MFKVVALSVILATSSAFVPQAPRFGRPQNALQSQPATVNGSMSGKITDSSDSKASIADEGRMKAMESRLAAFERNAAAFERSAAAFERSASLAKGGTRPMADQDLRLATGKSLDATSSVIVQGGSLKTFSGLSPDCERCQVILKTEGRPLEADVELWQGPDNTPQKMRIYVEDGKKRPFHAVIETPRGPNTISIRNTAQMEFPLFARIDMDVDDSYSMSKGSGGGVAAMAGETYKPTIIQGGALRTYAFDPSVDSVQVLLRTDGRPLNARIELLQGPNNNKQVVELYTEDGLDRPFFAIIETPGSGNVVRVVNTATVEFPLTATVEPYEVGSTAQSAGGGWSSSQWSK